ncbi:hypothetical protein SUVZ_10G1920 [Saccharomyces uvarum]|uniref:Agglutinin-like protein N-terminal domain-containing protein n=1 Tax=Saccharomyces uvarum TaxID=230603 RepID=A0ABN8WF01_SACUV|nr:hypothetical protein SUVZ_10G1920 [Saccharomyces uvarum]
MLIFLKIVVWLCSLALTSAADIDNISFSNLEIAPLTSNKQPDQGWTASFDFTIADPSSIKEGDQFTLSMPHVYRVKLSDPYQTTTISLNDGTEAFKCYVSQQAAYLYEDTILTCTAQTDLSSYNSIDGSITFSLNFSNGDSKYAYELENAKFFKSGPMLIQLGDQMSDTVDFDSATFTENVLHSGRTTGYGSFESYHLGMRCPNGHFLGGTEKINYDNSNHNVSLDCSSVQVYSSNDFNDWWFPQSYNDINADVTCFGSSLWITLDEELDNGEMVWVNALQSLPVGTNTIDHVLQFQYSCLDTIANTTYATEFSTTREFIVYQGEGLATASAKNAFTTSTTTTGWTGTYTSTYSTDSTFTVGTDTQTTPEVIIHVETPSTRLTSTTTTGWTGTYTSTYSTDSTFTVGTDTQTTPEVIIHVETPSTRLTSTTTTGWTGTYTSTYSTDSTFTVGTDTQTTPEVIIHVETPSTRLTSTTTTGWTGTYTSTYSTDSNFTVGTDTQTTPEVIIHVETPSTEQTLTMAVTSTSTTAWSVTINSTSSVSLSTAFETSNTPDTPVVSTKSEHATITTSTIPVSSEKSTTTADRNLTSSAISFLNVSASNSQSFSPSISSSAPDESSAHISKSSLRSSLVHTSEQVPSSSIKMETKVTSGHRTLSTTSRMFSSSLNETASSSQDTKIETSIISSLMVHYSSAPSSQPSPFNLQVSSTSTSHSISIYEGKASTFFSSEFSSIFFLVLSYLLY